MPEIPSWVYGAIGVAVVSNLGILGTLITLVFKAGKWVSKMEANDEDNRNMSVRAHKRIDRLEQ